MPDHWHFVLWPERDGDLGRFMHHLTVTHTARWKQHKKQVGFGHLYQDRYKSFPIESDDHFYQVVRYVERNPLRATMVRRAEHWQYSSRGFRNWVIPDTVRCCRNGHSRDPVTGWTMSIASKRVRS